MHILSHLIAERVADLDHVRTRAVVEGRDVEVLVHGAGKIVAGARTRVGGVVVAEDVDVFLAEGVVDLEDAGEEVLVLVVQVVVRDRVERVAKELRGGYDVDVWVICRVEALEDGSVSIYWAAAIMAERNRGCLPVEPSCRTASPQTEALG